MTEKMRSHESGILGTGSAGQGRMAAMAHFVWSVWSYERHMAVCKTLARALSRWRERARDSAWMKEVQQWPEGAAMAADAMVRLMEEWRASGQTEITRRAICEWRAATRAEAVTDDEWSGFDEGEGGVPVQCGGIRLEVRNT